MAVDIFIMMIFYNIRLTTLDFVEVFLVASFTYTAQRTVRQKNDRAN